MLARRALTLAAVALAVGALAAADGQSRPEGPAPGQIPEGVGAEAPRPVVLLPAVDNEVLLSPWQVRRSERELWAAAARQASAQPGRQRAPLGGNVGFYDPVNGYYYYPNQGSSVVILIVGPPEDPVAVYRVDETGSAVRSPQYYAGLAGQLLRQGPSQQEAPTAEASQEAEQFASRLSPMLAGPARVDRFFALGEARLRSGKAGEAFAAFSRAARTQPDSPAPRVAMGLALISAGQPAQAVRLLRQNMADFGGWGGVKVDFAQAFANPQALDVIERQTRGAIARDPTDTDLKLALGFLHFIAGESKQASEVLWTVHDANSSDPLANGLLLAAQRRLAEDQKTGEAQGQTE